MTILRIVCASVATFGLCLGGAQACSIVTAPFTGINPEEFVFLGEVTGYAPSSDPTSLVLKVLAVIQAPVDMGDEVELRNDSADDSMCQHTTGLGEFSQYPVGSRLKVITDNSYPREPKSGKQRLVLSFSAAHSLVAMKPASGTKEKDGASVDSELNYEFKYRCDGNISWNELEFARRQDAWRLQRSRSEHDSLAILLRMASCHHNARLLLSSDQDTVQLPGEKYGALVNHYLSREKDRSLVREKLTMTRYVMGSLTPDEKLLIEKRKASAGDAQFQMLLGANLLDMTEALYGEERAQIAHRHAAASEDNRPQILAEARSLVARQRSREVEALDWLNKSAKRGFLPAYWKLAGYYSRAAQEAWPDDVLRWQHEQQRVARTGVALARRGAAAKDPIAIATLAAFYMDGYGVVDPNEEKARRLACQLDMDAVASKIYPLTELVAEAGCDRLEPQSDRAQGIRPLPTKP